MTPIGLDYLPLYLIAALAVLDVVTTIRALRQPGLHEANDFVAWLMSLGRLWIVIKLAATAGALWLLRDQSGLNVWLAWGIVAAYAAIIANNIRLTREAG